MLAFHQFIVRILVMLCCCLSLVSCNNSNDKNIDEVEKISPTAIVAQTLLFSQQEYSLVNINKTEASAIQAYWPNSSDMPDELVTSLNLLLPQLTLLFAQQHFSFANTAQIEQQADYKKVLFIPVTDDAVMTELTFTLSQDNNVLVTFAANALPELGALYQPLINLIYQSERAKYQEDSDIFGKLVRLGLSLHFVEQTLSVGDFTPPDVIANKALLSTWMKVKKSINEQTLVTDWFASPASPDRRLAASLGYSLVKKHFDFYVGSNASNSFSVDGKLFMPWLDSHNRVIKKQQKFVNNTNDSEKIEASELYRQANAFIGSYFLKGYNQQKLIALTFDDGPSEYTNKILDVLEQSKVPASFFWQGNNLAEYENVIKRSIAAGHTIANHSWDHAHGMDYSPAELWQQQVMKTNEALQKTFDITPRFYRPPYGEITDEQVVFLAEKGMKIIAWSIDSIDWDPRFNSVQQIENKIINNQHHEMISLMHDAGGNRQNTVDALAEIINFYQEQDYQFVNLETLLGISDKQ